MRCSKATACLTFSDGKGESVLPQIIESTGSISGSGSACALCLLSYFFFFLLVPVGAFLACFTSLSLFFFFLPHALVDSFGYSSENCLAAKRGDAFTVFFFPFAFVGVKWRSGELGYIIVVVCDWRLFLDGMVAYVITDVTVRGVGDADTWNWITIKKPEHRCTQTSALITSLSFFFFSHLFFFFF